MSWRRTRRQYTCVYPHCTYAVRTSTTTLQTTKYPTLPSHKITCPQVAVSHYKPNNGWRNFQECCNERYCKICGPNRKLWASPNKNPSKQRQTDQTSLIVANTMSVFSSLQASTLVELCLADDFTKRISAPSKSAAQNADVDCDTLTSSKEPKYASTKTESVTLQRTSQASTRKPCSPEPIQDNQ